MAKAAIGQICSSNSMTSNLAQCVKLVGQAANAGAKILFLPEASDYIGTSAQESLCLARPVASSPFVTGLQAAAAKHSIAVHVGIHVPVVTAKPIDNSNNDKRQQSPIISSIPQTPESTSETTNQHTFSSSSSSSTSSQTRPQQQTQTKLHNRTIYITPQGTLLETASYNKLHLFDYSTLRESSSTEAGPRLIPPIQSPIGRLGSLICFDLRFPEPALHLTRASPHGKSPSEASNNPPNKPANEPSGASPYPAQILLYPSAFTVSTGRAHWEVLLRARAIETQSYVIAAAQVGAHNISPSSKNKKPRVSYGHSTVVDPWGRVILEMKGVRPDWNWDCDGDGEGEDAADAVEEGAVGQLGVVDIDLDEWERVRERMPLIRRT